MTNVPHTRHTEFYKTLNFSNKDFQIIFPLFNHGISAFKSEKDFYLETLVLKDLKFLITKGLIKEYFKCKIGFFLVYNLIILHLINMYM